MKKVLLSGLVFLAGLTAFAQTGPCAQGYFPNESYAGDAFTRRSQWNNVYWWTQGSGPVDVKVDSGNVAGDCETNYRPFSYSFTRTGNGKLQYTITQQYGKYEPIGVGFGKAPKGTPGDSTTNVLDLSEGNLFLSFTFTNTSDSVISLRYGLQDSSNNLVNAKGFMELGSFYKDEKSTVFNPGQTKTVWVNFNPTVDSVIYQPIYKYDPDLCFAGSDSVANQAFNPKAVAGVTFTVINNNNSKDADGYKPYPLINATFEFSNFHVGAPAVICTGLEDAYLAGSSFKVAPNPSSSFVEFPASENVKVMDAMGKLVYSAASASKVDVSSMQKGVYLLQTSKGTARFIVE